MDLDPRLTASNPPPNRRITERMSVTFTRPQVEFLRENADRLGITVPGLRHRTGRIARLVARSGNMTVVSR